MNNSDFDRRLHVLQEMTPDGPMARSKLRKLAIKALDSSPDSLRCILQNERLVDLESFSLAGCSNCDDEAVATVTGALSKLRVLDLSATDITGVGVKQALQSKHLTKLVVNNCRRIGIDAIDWARSQGVQVEYRMLDDVSRGKKVRY